MQQTLIVYSVLLAVFIICPLFLHLKFADSDKSVFKYWGVIAILPISLYGFIMGYRYNVGVDWRQYKSIYENFEHGISIRDNLEYGYVFLNKFFISLDLEYTAFFFFEGAFMIFSLYYFFKDRKYILIFALPLYLIFFFSDIENLSRQFLAMSIFYIALKNLIDKNYKTYWLFAIVASGIHSVTTLFTVLFFIINGLKRIKLKLLLIIYIVFNIISEFILGLLFAKFGFLLNIMNKDAYSKNGLGNSKYEFDFDVPIRTQIIGHCLALFIIYFGYKIVFNTKNVRDQTIFYLAYIGLLLVSIVRMNELFARLNFYFESFVPFLMAIILHEVFINKNIKLRKLKVPLVLIVMYYVYLYYGQIVLRTNTFYPYKFIWDI